MILIEDPNCRTVEQEDFNENIQIQDKDVVNMREVNQETWVNRRSQQLGTKESMNVLLGNAAIS